MKLVGPGVTPLTSRKVAPVSGYLRELTTAEPARYIAVVVPELAERRLYHFLLRRRATLLKGLLVLHGNRRIAIVSTPWYLRE